MNRGHGRVVLCACLTLLGCGARTSALEGEHGGPGAGGASGTAGSGTGVAGTPSNPSGGAAQTAGFGGSTPNPAAGSTSAGASVGGGVGTAGIAELCSALGSTSCAECQCATCAPAIESCFSDLGCALIFACAGQTGCTGISCYSPATCQPVIDRFGGLAGASMRTVLTLLGCAGSAQASCACN